MIEATGNAAAVAEVLCRGRRHRAHMLSKDADYIWARPALLARKFRAVELRAGLPTQHARRGSAFDYNIPAKRSEERSRVEKAEAAYTAMTSRWRTRPDRLKAVEKSGNANR